jgi:uncharacterized protein (DUF2236 family)
MVSPQVSPPVLRIADVADEAILLAGGARAILLQLANPAVGRGVAEHSDFANRPLDRLRGTLTYLYVIVYGTPEESALVARRVGATHESVRGAGYDARDEGLQLWVAATLYETAMRVHELVLGPLSAANAESLLADYAIVGTALGVPASAWPVDRAAFTEYWQRSEANLRVDDSAQRVARELLYSRRGPWWLTLAMPTIRVVTAGLLPTDLRIAYGLPLDSARYARLVRVVRAIYPRLPRAIRQWPRRHYLRKFRQGLIG